MAKIKVSEATEVQLNWLVAKCEGKVKDCEVHANNVFYGRVTSGFVRYCPSENWAQAGPIIERENIGIIRCEDGYATDKRGFTTSKRIPVWGATIGRHDSDTVYGSQGDNWGDAYSLDVDGVTHGPTPLIAAMRCYVVSKLGALVEIPDKLV